MTPKERADALVARMRQTALLLFRDDIEAAIRAAVQEAEEGKAELLEACRQTLVLFAADYSNVSPRIKYSDYAAMATRLEQVVAKAEGRTA